MKENLLRVVRTALARTRPLSDHPDPNLLAAFAENTLLARERAAIAGHLADCAECREFLALAFGTVDAGAAAAAAPTPVRRWSPVWNWAASMAAICVVVSAVWEFRAQRVPPLEPPPGPPVIGAPATPNPVAVKTASAAPVRQFTPPPRAVPPAPPPSAPPQTADAISPVRQQAHALQYGQQAAAPEPGAQYLVQEQAAPTAPVVARSAPARMKAASAFGAAVRPGSVLNVLWTIASATSPSGLPRGIIQRSNDGGATWVAVPVNEQVSFRAVVSAGSEVWAGGSAGALFHSTDSGDHWEREPINITGTIVEIGASAGGEVRIVTDARERWVSQDNGRTWRLTDTPR